MFGHNYECLSLGRLYKSTKSPSELIGTGCWLNYRSPESLAVTFSAPKLGQSWPRIVRRRRYGKFHFRFIGNYSKSLTHVLGSAFNLGDFPNTCLYHLKLSALPHPGTRLSQRHSSLGFQLKFRSWANKNGTTRGKINFCLSSCSWWRRRENFANQRKPFSRIFLQSSELKLFF